MGTRLAMRMPFLLHSCCSPQASGTRVSWAQVGLEVPPGPMHILGRHYPDLSPWRAFLIAEESQNLTVWHPHPVLCPRNTLGVTGWDL